MISNINIKNYKSIKDLVLPLKKINILIGSNGVGKSNFISFFKFLRRISEKEMKSFIAEEGSSEDLLYFGSKASQFLSAAITFNDINKYSFTLVPNKDNTLTFQVENTGYKRTTTWTNQMWGSINGESGIIPPTDKVSGYVVKHLNSFRVYHFHDTSKTSSMRKPAQVDDNRHLREDGSNLPAYLYLLSVKYPKEFQKIEMTIRSVAPYFERFNLSPDRLNEDQIRLEWKEKGSDAYFSAKHLSDGTLRFIALATLLLQPQAQGVIIIDEPELGLHPFAINKLAGLIKKASEHTQIIISTQSVNLVDNFAPEDIITVDRSENQSIFKRQSSEELSEWLKEYSISDLWNKNVIGGRV